MYRFDLSFRRYIIICLQQKLLSSVKVIPKLLYRVTSKNPLSSSYSIMNVDNISLYGC